MHPSGFDSDGASTACKRAAVFGAVLLVAVATAPAAGTPAQSASTDHTAIASADARAAADVENGGTIGDVIEITVSVPDGASGRVFLGSTEKAYLSNVTFTDDGDGEVRLSLNTYLAGGHLGNESRAWSAESGTIRNVTLHTAPLSKPLEPAIYDVNVTVGSTTREGTPIPLQAASVDNLTLATAPASQFGDDLEDITATPSDRHAIGDTLVATVDVNGVFGLLDAQPGETTTARFRSLVTSENASFEMRPGRTDADLDLERSFDNDAFRVYTDAAAGRLTVAMDTEALRYDGGTNRLDAGETYTAVFVINDASGLTTDEAAWADEVRVTDRTASFETDANGTVRLPSVSDARLAGTTALAPGTEIVVQARADGRFLRHNQTTVDDEGRFSAILDLSSVDPGTAFTASVDGLDPEIPGLVVNASERVGDTESTTPSEPGTPEVTTQSEGVNQVQNPNPDGSATPPAATTTRSVTTTDDAGPGFGLTATLLAVVAVAVLALGRRRSR